MKLLRATQRDAAESSARACSPSSRYRYSKWRYRLLFRLLDGFCAPLFRWFRPRATRAHADPRSILVVQLDHIGDAVITTPMLRSIKQRFPDATIDVLASQSNREVFEASRWVNRVHVSERNWHSRSRGRQLWLGEALRLARHMRRHRYDLGIDPRGDFLITLLLWLAGIPRRLGWACGGGGFLLTDVARWDPARHELEARRVLMQVLGVRPSPEQFRPELLPSWADIYLVREMLQSLPDSAAQLLVLHVSAGTPAKRWPTEHWSALIGGLLAEGRCVILVGDSGDRATGRQLARGCCGVIDWTGRLTLMQLAALLSEAELFIGCDSGPAHIASAVGVPAVVLFSGTNRSECWRPLGPDVQVLQNSVACAPCCMKQCPIAGHPCMTGISPRDVVAAVRRAIGNAIVRCEAEAFRGSA